MELLESLEGLHAQMIKASSVYEKITLLDEFPEVIKFLDHFSFRSFLAGLTPECESALKQIIAIGQAEVLWDG